MEAISTRPGKHMGTSHKGDDKHSKGLSKKEVKMMIKSAQLQVLEPKSFDAGTVCNPGYGGLSIITKLSTIPQGDTDTTRDGDQLAVEWTEVRYNVLVNASDVSNMVRVIYFCWHFDDGGQPPTPALILQAPTTPLSAYNRDSVKEKAFSVLSDRLHATYSGGVGQECAYYRNKKKFKITFTSGGNTGKNHVYLLAVSDSGISPFPTLSSYHRTQFFDA
jgi:hypothetical protein